MLCFQSLASFFAHFDALFCMPSSLLLLAAFIFLWYSLIVQKLHFMIIWLYSFGILFFFFMGCRHLCRTTMLASYCALFTFSPAALFPVLLCLVDADG